MRFWTNLMVFWNKNSLRKRLIVYFTATILVMSAFSVFPYYSISLLMQKMSSTFEMNIELNDLTKSIERVDNVYENYLSTKYSKSLDDYYKYTYELKTKADSLEINNLSIENELLLRDIHNMIYTYLDRMNETVMARRSRMVDNYLIQYKESTKVRQYIYEYIQMLNSTLFMQNTDRYLSMKNKFYQVETFNIGMILTMLVLNIFLIILFAYRITKPISELSSAADEITHGNFNVPCVKVNTNDEMGVMAEAFNRMTESIRLYIQEVEEKVELERKLQEKEMENLIMKSNLREAELQALQSQINPHFLYNTLNTGAQLAMLEGADRACSFIENAAELFRYSLRNLDKPVTLGDEIRNAENYMSLLNERFAGKIELTVNKDQSIMHIKIPCMILQPLVENAFIHGISDVEYNGVISLNAKRLQDKAVISIKDNGKGMSEDRISEILNGELNINENDEIHKGHTNGIGINNLLSRLKIFYGIDDFIEINSELGHGTEIILSLPLDMY